MGCGTGAAGGADGVGVTEVRFLVSVARAARITLAGKTLPVVPPLLMIHSAAARRLRRRVGGRAARACGKEDIGAGSLVQHAGHVPAGGAEGYSLASDRRTSPRKLNTFQT